MQERAPYTITQAQRHDPSSACRDTLDRVELIKRGLVEGGASPALVATFDVVAVLDIGPDGCYAPLADLAGLSGLDEVDVQQALDELLERGILFRGRAPRRGLRVTRLRAVTDHGWRPRYGGRVAIPGALLDAPVPDQTIRVFARVAELDNGPRGCFETVESMAAALGVSRQDVSAAIALLVRRKFIRRAQTDREGLKVVPFSFSRDGDEGYALVTERQCLDLTSARHYRAWCLVWRDHERRRPVTVAGVRRSLFNVGTSKGRDRNKPVPVHTATASRILDDLDASGWIVRTFRPGKATETIPQVAGQTLLRGALVERRAERVERRRGATITALPLDPERERLLAGAVAEMAEQAQAIAEAEQDEADQRALGYFLVLDEAGIPGYGMVLAERDEAVAEHEVTAGQMSLLDLDRDPVDVHQGAEHVVHNPPQQCDAPTGVDPVDPPQRYDEDPPQRCDATPRNGAPHKELLLRSSSDCESRSFEEPVTVAEAVTRLQVVSGQDHLFRGDEEDRRPGAAPSPAKDQDRGDEVAASVADDLARVRALRSTQRPGVVFAGPARPAAPRRSAASRLEPSSSGRESGLAQIRRRSAGILSPAGDLPPDRPA